MGIKRGKRAILIQGRSDVDRSKIAFGPQPNFDFFFSIKA
jgi:hypothetical protein